MNLDRAGHLNPVTFIVPADTREVNFAHAARPPTASMYCARIWSALGILADGASAFAEFEGVVACARRGSEKTDATAQNRQKATKDRPTIRPKFRLSKDASSFPGNLRAPPGFEARFVPRVATAK